MHDVTSGKIFVADHEGVYSIKMQGDVRLTLCIPFDNFIESLFVQDDFCNIVFDLTEAEGLDSTTLGLIAKLAVKSRETKQIQPAIVGASPSIHRLLDVTGITDLCDVIDAGDGLESQLTPSSPLSNSTEDNDEEYVRRKVLEAHQVLASLNDANKESFKDLIEVLSQAQ